MSENYLGKEFKKLGFGLMRLPMKGEDIDLEQVKTMVDKFIKEGFTYFDTAYVYHGGNSEVVAKEALVKRYPRESFQLATKMPVWEAKKTEDYQRLFDIQLERTGAGYFDFYLLHALDKNRAVEVDQMGGWDFVKAMKEKGLIKHFGFSFHDDAQALDEILTKHPETEFVQLQLNYIDWENEGVQSRLCYEVARKHNIPIVVMEPIKGGSLASMRPEIEEIYKAANPELSIASWAIRYVASLEGIVTVLSGMSNIEQMDDNLSYMKDFNPLKEEEFAVIQTAIEEMAKIPTVPCTACKYCVDDCPQKINIPGAFSSINKYKVYNNVASAKGEYGWVTQGGGKASDCIACGSCESHCPQHINIIETLKEVAGILE